MVIYVAVMITLLVWTAKLVSFHSSYSHTLYCHIPIHSYSHSQIFTLISSLSHAVTFIPSHSHTFNTFTVTFIISFPYTHFSIHTGVEVLFPPSFIEEPTTVFTLILFPAFFVCSVTGNPQPTIEWTKDGIVLEGRVQDVLLFPQVILEDRGEYQCTATNSEGIIQSNPVYLNIDSEYKSCCVVFHKICVYSSDVLKFVYLIGRGREGGT